VGNQDHRRASGFVVDPVGRACRKINFGLICSDFHQPFGTYNGRFKDESNRIYPITDAFGLAEHHLTRY